MVCPLVSKLVGGTFFFIFFRRFIKISDNKKYCDHSLDVRLRDILANLHFDWILLEHVDERQKLILKQFQQSHLRELHHFPPPGSHPNGNVISRSPYSLFIQAFNGSFT